MVVFSSHVDFMGFRRMFIHMRTIILAWSTVSLAVSSASVAQVTAALQWEVNDGSGWRAGTITTSASQVQARLMASWAPAAVFEWSSFDATISSPTGAFDTAEGFLQHPYLRFYSDGFATTRFGDVVKIDRPGDTAAPGAGSLWVTAFQSSSVPERLSDNPIELFRYTLNLDTATLGLRTLSQVHAILNPRQGAGPNNSVSLDIDGALRAVPTTRADARINVIPAPGLLPCIVAMATLSRRYRSRD